MSTEMLLCGKREIEQWDLRLNAAYRKLLARMTTAERVELRQEQRLWLRRHLAETRRLAMDPTNGSAAFLDSQAFELDDLSSRVRTLEARLSR